MVNQGKFMVYRYSQKLAKHKLNKLTMLILTMFAAFALALSSFAQASAYTFPSTNDINRANGHPHVNFVNNDVGEATLEFVNNTNSLAFYEYRIDGAVLTSGTAHPVVTGDFIYPGICVDNRSAPVCDGTPQVHTFTADEFIEVRLALGGERDWDFDWTQFDVLPDAQTKEDCKNGGWQNYGFRNQGLCIQFFNTGKDSRTG